MYDDLNTMFKRKKNEFKQMYADDSKVLFWLPDICVSYL